MVCPEALSTPQTRRRSRYHLRKMDVILKQLGELFLNAVPTVVLFLLTWLSYTVIVHRPLQRVLAERHARTEGAIAKAQADVAAADAKSVEYENRLREARMAVYRAQEEQRRKAQSVRGEVVAQARAAADERVKAAKAEIERDVKAAQGNLQSESERLANEIIRTVLKPAGASQMGGRA